jgi:cytochrome c556
MVGLIEWLRDFNRARPCHERVGFYGIDLYGEEDARRKVLTLLEAMDPELEREVAERYACLDRYGDDLTEYARGITRGRASCEAAVAEVVDLLQAHRADLESDDPALFFHLEQTARVVRGAEHHYRAMPVPGPESWNFRVDHLFETVDRLHDYFGPGSKGIVWAHNTHIGSPAGSGFPVGPLRTDRWRGWRRKGWTANEHGLSSGSAWGTSASVPVLERMTGIRNRLTPPPRGAQTQHGDRRMKRILASTVLGAFALGIASTALADLKPEEQIKFRQAGYSFMSWNMGKIKSNLEGDFDADQVAAAANAINAIANSGMGALYGPGTDKNIGDVKTRLKPEFFDNLEDVGVIAGNFVAATNALAAAAAEGDQVDVSNAFGKVGEACKACHDKYRADE